VEREREIGFMPKTTCPECGNDEGYHRVRTADFRCKKCGAVWRDKKK